MKPETQKPKLKIVRVYDLKKEARACRQNGYQCRKGYAYMSGGRVCFALSLDWMNDTSTPAQEHQLFMEWLRESMDYLRETSFYEPFLKRYDLRPTQLSHRRVAECIAFSRGESWHVWNEIEVCRVLCNPGKKRGEGFAFIPIEDTIFDPDRRPGVWQANHAATVEDRCLEFATDVLRQAAYVYVQAKHLLDGFSEAFAALDTDGFLNTASPAARMIREAKEAAQRQIHACHMLAIDGRTQDEAVASRQGFLMGSLLAQARAIIASERSQKLAARLGAGKQHSKFWKWIWNDARFQGKLAGEAWRQLDGLVDPDHPTGKLRVENDVLIRGNSDKMSEKSFCAKYRRR